MNLNIKEVLLKDKNKAYYLYNKNDNNDTLLDKCANALKQGYRIIIFFNKELKDIEALNLANKMQQLCSFYDALFIIKGRFDIAKIIKADGVLIDNTDIQINYAKHFLNEDKLIGYYTNTIQDAFYAQENHFDYIVINKDNKALLIDNRIANIKIKIIEIEE